MRHEIAIAFVNVAIRTQNEHINIILISILSLEYRSRLSLLPKDLPRRSFNTKTDTYLKLLLSSAFSHNYLHVSNSHF